MRVVSRSFFPDDRELIGFHANSESMVVTSVSPDEVGFVVDALSDHDAIYLVPVTYAEWTSRQTGVESEDYTLTEVREALSEVFSSPTPERAEGGKLPKPTIFDNPTAVEPVRVLPEPHVVLTEVAQFKKMMERLNSEG